MLINEILLNYKDKLVISASGMAGMGSSNEIITKKINDSDLKPGKWTAITTYINSKQKQEGRSDGQSFTIEK